MDGCAMNDRARRQQNEDLETWAARDTDRRTNQTSYLQRTVVRGVPNPRRRRCNNCGFEVELNDDWTCPTPGCTKWGSHPTQVIHTTGRRDCPKCGRSQTVLLVGNQVRPLRCQCEKTRAEVEREELAAKHQEHEAAKQRQRLRDAREARECWKRSGYSCGLNNPFAHCYACSRHPNTGGAIQGELRAFEREEAKKARQKRA